MTCRYIVGKIGKRATDGCLCAYCTTLAENTSSVNHEQSKTEMYIIYYLFCTIFRYIPTQWEYKIWLWSYWYIPSFILQGNAYRKVYIHKIYLPLWTVSVYVEKIASYCVWYYAQECSRSDLRQMLCIHPHLERLCFPLTSPIRPQNLQTCFYIQAVERAFVILGSDEMSMERSLNENVKLLCAPWVLNDSLPRSR